MKIKYRKWLATTFLISSTAFSAPLSELPESYDYPWGCDGDRALIVETNEAHIPFGRLCADHLLIERRSKKTSNSWGVPFRRYDKVPDPDMGPQYRAYYRKGQLITFKNFTEMNEFHHSKDNFCYFEIGERHRKFYMDRDASIATIKYDNGTAGDGDPALYVVRTGDIKETFIQENYKGNSTVYYQVKLYMDNRDYYARSRHSEYVKLKLPRRDGTSFPDGSKATYLKDALVKLVCQGPLLVNTRKIAKDNFLNKEVTSHYVGGRSYQDMTYRDAMRVSLNVEQVKEILGIKIPNSSFMNLDLISDAYEFMGD